MKHIEPKSVRFVGQLEASAKTHVPVHPPLILSLYLSDSVPHSLLASSSETEK